MDSLEKDLKNLRAKAQERDGWRKFSEQVKSHNGL
jgi:hypothetical protein